MDGVANGLSEEFFKSSFKDWDFFDPSKTKGWEDAATVSRRTYGK